MQLTGQGSEHHHLGGSQPSPAASDYKPVPLGMLDGLIHCHSMK